MNPAVTKLFDLKLKKDKNEGFPSDISQKENETKIAPELSDDFMEALAILGLDQPAFSFSEDYDWMIETTKQILLNDGIEYFRNNVLSLIKAWDKYSTS